MRRLYQAIFLSLSCLLPVSAIAAETLSVEPFSYGTASQEQKDMWNSYLAEQSKTFGCTYGDDARLSQNPRGLLESLAKGEEIEPVQITLRSFMMAGDSTQSLLARNMKIASVTCNPVYYYDGDLIGQPVLPFEEYLKLITDVFQSPEDLETVAWLAKSTKVAPLDPRVLWPLFILREEHYTDLDLSYPKLEYIVRAMAPQTEDIRPETAPAQLFAAAVNLGNDLEGRECRDVTFKRQPAGTLFFDKDIALKDIIDANKQLAVLTGKGNVFGADPDLSIMSGTEIEDEPRSWLNTERNFIIRTEDCSK